MSDKSGIWGARARRERSPESSDESSATAAEAFDERSSGSSSEGDGIVEAVRGASGDTPTVCVIGGGYSGSVTAAHLLRRAQAEQRGLHVFLLERNGGIGEGVAYRTRDEAHVLNVPARNMSALAADPDHFVRWLEAAGLPCDPTTFAARRDYGRYVR